MVAEVGRPKVAIKRGEVAGGPGRKTRASVKRSEVQKVREMMRTDPVRLASYILDGREAAECPVPMAQLHEVFEGRWKRVEGAFRDLGGFVAVSRAKNEYCATLFSPREVVTHLKATDKTSAAGVDGVKRDDLLTWDPEGKKLAKLYGSWLAAGYVPTGVKTARTVLLPKSTDQQSLLDASNWRPITIGSMLIRLFSRLLNGRLTDACEIHARQRGFRSTPGCAENLHTSTKLCRMCKKEKRPLAVVLVDVAKAFDTVTHDHLLAVLGQRGLDEHVIKTVQSLYRDGLTTLEVGGVRSEEISMEVGVRQGDPLSPLLFNQAIDPLLHALECHGRGGSR